MSTVDRRAWLITLAAAIGGIVLLAIGTALTPFMGSCAALLQK